VAVVQLPYDRIGQEAIPHRLNYTVPGASGSDKNDDGGNDDNGGGQNPEPPAP